MLAPAAEQLSDEERGRRERQRTAALSGILEYSFAPSGRALLFPLDGRLYYYDLAKPAGEAVLQITHAEGFATDATISPRGRYVAYVRNQNLYAYELAGGTEKALTGDGGGPIKNGMAEFVAQEEMDRSTGYWWAPDDRHIAFARVDESPVKIVQRFEIAADNVSTFAQRYPAAGGANVLIRIGVADVSTGAVTWIDLGPEKDIYVARVNWLPDGKTIAIQRQSRDQRRLDLIFANIATGESRVVLTETSSTWIELNDELTFLGKSAEFVWESARDGFQHLYLYDYDGHLKRRLTAGPWNVDDFRARAIKGIDEKRRLIYFTATEKSPVERQLYRTSLDTQDPRAVSRVSREDGVHAVTMSRDTRVYVDQFHQQHAAAPGERARRRRPPHRISRGKPPRSAASGRPVPGRECDCRSSAALPPRMGRRCNTGCSNPPTSIPRSVIRPSSRCTAAPACSGCSIIGPATPSRKS